MQADDYDLYKIWFKYTYIINARMKREKYIKNSIRGAWTAVY